MLKHSVWKIVAIVGVLLASIANPGIALAATEDYVVPSWQSVIPDTGVVVDLANENTSQWTLESDDGLYYVQDPRVPADLLTNLMEAGILEDPYQDKNFLTQRFIWMGGEDAKNPNSTAQRTRSWIYTSNFTLPGLSPTLQTSSKGHGENPVTWRVIVEGVKMGAHVAINGIPIGTVTNQFLRYSFDVDSRLFAASRDPHVGAHTLTVTFDPSIPVDGRFTACSGGWDWAPYCKVADAQNRRSYTLGITQPIYLVAIQDFAISAIVPKVYYHGAYPMHPMGTHPDGQFELQVDIHLDLVQHSRLNVHSVSVAYPGIGNATSDPAIMKSASQSETIMSTSRTFESSEVKLWWPNGMGDQNLYDVEITIATTSHSRYKVRRRVGKSESHCSLLYESDV